MLNVYVDHPTKMNTLNSKYAKRDRKFKRDRSDDIHRFPTKAEAIISVEDYCESLTSTSKKNTTDAFILIIDKIYSEESNLDDDDCSVDDDISTLLDDFR